MSHGGEIPELDKAARRFLALQDDTIDALDAEQRDWVAASWTRRAAAEVAAGAMFAVITQGLFRERAPQELLWLAARGTCDELRHAEICRYVALRYGGEAPPRALPPALEEVRFGDAPAGLSRVLYALLNTCVNETIATAYLNACLADARGPLADAALRELLHDEVDHGRLGFALLASDWIDAQAREHLALALPTLLRIGRDAWLDTAARLPADSVPGHGCPSGTVVRAVVEEALRELVLPGFAHVGIDTSKGAAWLLSVSIE